MFKGLTKGKLIAGIIALGIASFFWNIFFPPGGSGANILLGIFVVIFFVYYFANYIGALIDQELFPGGSKERARSYHALLRFVKESKEHLSAIHRSKRKRKKIGEKALDDFEKALEKASLVLKEVENNWRADDKVMREQERILKEAYDRLEQTSKVIFKLDRNWRFLYGMPSLIIALFCALLLREFVIEPYQIPAGSMIPSLLVGDHLFVSKFYYGLSKPFGSEPSFIMRWRTPKPGDVVVFKAPAYVGRHAGQAWIKRVIATEGQTVRISDNVVYVDGQPYEHIAPEALVTYMDFFGFGGPQGGVWKEQTAKRTVEKIGEVEHPIHIALYPPDVSLGPYWPVGTRDLPGLICRDNGCTVKKGYVFVMGDNRGNSHDSRRWGALLVDRVIGNALFIWMSVDGSKQLVKIGPFSLPKFRLDRWFTRIS
jgi:signal peptidase I